MPALSFNKKFVPHILNGTKKQTIRAFRKNPIKVGNHLFLYTGMRTKECEKIGEAICVAIYKISIRTDGITISPNFEVPINQLNHYAQQDGFKNWDDMRRWWVLTHDLPFNGNLIMWENFIPA